MDLLFIYQTRTIQRLSRVTASVVHNPTKCLSCNVIRHWSGKTSIEAEQSVDWKRKYFVQQAERRRRITAGESDPEPAKISPAPSTTITETESEAFQLLHDIAVRQQDAKQQEVSGRLSTDVKAILSLFPGLPIGRKVSKSLDNDEEEGTMGHSTGSLNDSTAQLVDRTCLEHLRYCKNLLMAIQGKTSLPDIDVKEFLEKEVFPLLQFIATTSERMSTPSPPQTASSTELTSASSSSRPRPALKILIPSLQTQPSTPPTLPMISRLYPSLVLLTLRVLTRQFPLSLITSSLLSLVRSQGPTSYVLACNTHFYNTYLLLRWNTYSSLSEISSLLSEMERGAVEFDMNTLRLLKDIAEERTRDLARGTDNGWVPMGSRKGEEEEASFTSLVRRPEHWWLHIEQLKGWEELLEWQRVIESRLSEKSEDEDDMDSKENYEPARAEQRLNRPALQVEREVWL